MEKVFTFQSASFEVRPRKNWLDEKSKSFFF